MFKAFAWYLRWYFRRHFHAVRMSGAAPLIAPGRPLIVCANHPSWWDPALFILISDMLMPQRAGFGPMEAQALEKYRLFRRLGVFGIDTASHDGIDTASHDGIDTASRAGAARFLTVSLHVLSHPAAVLWITAEGHFSDPRRRPVRLRHGIAHLLRHRPDAAVVPLAMEYAFWNERKPEALFRFGEPIAHEPSRDVAGWTAILEQRLAETMDALAKDAMQRDPRLFTTILCGSAGVGGIYDLWRRLQAWARGRRPQLAHEDDAPVPGQEPRA